MSATLKAGGWGSGPGRILLWAVPTVLLATPAVMMLQAVEGWLWSPFDFLFAAVLLYGTTALIDLAIGKGGSVAYKLGVALAALAAFLLIWINAAVGVIGDEGNPVNLVFAGVILPAAVGSVLARFQARGMALAMLAASALTAAIAVAVPVLGWGADEPPGTTGLTVLVGGFALMWALSAALFAKAASDVAQA